MMPAFASSKQHPPAPAPVWVVAAIFVPLGILGLVMLIAGLVGTIRKKKGTYK